MKSEEMLIDSLINGNDFKEFVRMYEKPNLFSVMGKIYREEWHSSFLCWLLDPNENHGLGAMPLKCFFELYNKKQEENHMAAHIDISSMSDVDFARFRFRTEEKIYSKINFREGRIDIFAKSENAILVIENKVKSKEHDSQTRLYYQYFESKDEYKNQQKYYVYLRVDKGDVAQDKHYVNITYQEVYDYVISKCLNCEMLDLDGKVVLEQYVINLSNPLNGIVMAHTNRDLCERIYCNHKDAIDLIRKTFANKDRDEESYICVNGKKYIKYLNEVLITLGEMTISEVNTPMDSLKGNELLRVLCENGIIVPDETEFIYKGYNMTFIVQVIEYEGEYRCISGFCEGDYDGVRSVDAIALDNNYFSTFSSLTDAVDSAVMVYKHSIGEKGFLKSHGPGSQGLREFPSGRTVEQLKQELKDRLMRT